MSEITIVLPDGAADAVVAQLQKMRRDKGQVPASLVREMAAALGMGESTLWRHIANGRPARRRGQRAYEMTDDDKLLYAKWTGNVAAVHRAKLKAGADVPSLRTLQRAFDAQLSNADRAYLTLGGGCRTKPGAVRRV